MPKKNTHTRRQTQLFSTARMAWLGALDLALTLTTLGLWAILKCVLIALPPSSRAIDLFVLWCTHLHPCHTLSTYLKKKTPPRSGDAAFNTVCEKSGCFPVPGEQMATSTISYSWAIWCVVLLPTSFPPLSPLSFPPSPLGPTDNNISNRHPPPP